MFCPAWAGHAGHPEMQISPSYSAVRACGHGGSLGTPTEARMGIGYAMNKMTGRRSWLTRAGRRCSGSLRRALSARFQAGS
jgi:hypothetical protein